MEQNDVLLRKQYFKILFPLMFSVLGGTINTLIDSVVVSQNLGSNGLAAVNSSMPLYLILCTIGSLIGGGTWILSSKLLGKEKVQESNEIFHNGLCWGALIGIIITILGLIFNSAIAGFLGGDANIYEYVRQYTFVSLLGTIPCLFIYFPMFFLQLEGKGKQISMCVTIMVTSDLLLDIIFLFAFGWGMYGAALASVCSNILCCLYGFYCLQKAPTNFSFTRKYFKLANFREIVVNGYPVALGNLFDAGKLLLINLLILSNYGSKALAVWAILNTIFELSLVISSGVARAANSMLSVYKSAMENSRIRMLIKIQLQSGILFSIIFGVVLLVLNVPIRYLFNGNENLLIPLLMVGITTLLQTISDIWSGYFQITDMGWVSGVQSLFRRLLFPVLALVLVVPTGIYLWSFLPIGALLTIICSYCLTAFVSLRSKNTSRPLTSILLLDDYLSENNKVIDFSFNANMEEACGASEQIADFCGANELSPKQTMKIQIAIEELIKIIIDRADNIKLVDARAYALEDVIGIQFRYAGSPYNPFEDECEDFDIEMNMIRKLGEEFRHCYTLGLNTINFCIFPEERNDNK